MGLLKHLVWRQCDISSTGLMCVFPVGVSTGVSHGGTYDMILFSPERFRTE